VHVLAAIVSGGLVGLTGCRADDRPPAATSAAGSQRAGSDAGAGPARLLVPDLPAAKLLQTRSRGDSQTFVRWCIDEPDAVKRVMGTLTREGWSDVATRGTGEHIGVAATRLDVRFSAMIGGHDDACAGTLVTATIARLGAVPAGSELIR